MDKALVEKWEAVLAEAGLASIPDWCIHGDAGAMTFVRPEHIEDFERGIEWLTGSAEKYISRRTLGLVSYLPREDRLLLHRLRQRVPQTMIAEELDRTQGAISQRKVQVHAKLAWLARLGLPHFDTWKRRHRQYADAWDASRSRFRRGNQWVSTSDIVETYLDNWSLFAAARDLGKNQSTLWTRMQSYLGGPARPPGYAVLTGIPDRAWANDEES